MKKLIPVLLALGLSGALAHAVVRTEAGGSESPAGKSETYRLQVPVEKAVDTVQVRLVLPPGVTFVRLLPQPGWTWSAEQDALGKVSAITWKGTLHPMEFGRFYFQAVNPENPGTLAWKVYQTSADGSLVAWDGSDPATPASSTSVK